MKVALLERFAPAMVQEQALVRLEKVRQKLAQSPLVGAAPALTLPPQFRESTELYTLLALHFQLQALHDFHII